MEWLGVGGQDAGMIGNYSLGKASLAMRPAGDSHHHLF